MIKEDSIKNIVTNKPIYVLGTGLSHNGSACLLKDGRICVAIEKERITRKKHDGENDTEAIQYCLDAEGITLTDLSLVVQNTNFGFFEYGNDYYHGKRMFNNEVKIPMVTISHHLAHAYNAIGTMPYSSAEILVIDGCGSIMDECIDIEDTVLPEDISKDMRHLFAEKDSFYFYDGEKLHVLYKDFSPLSSFLKEYPMYPPTTKDSIGGVYAAVSRYVFGNMMDEGKLMGLAPYGRPNVFKDKIFILKDNRIFVNYDWMRQFKSPLRPHDIFEKDFQYRADIAFWVQKEIEEAVLYIINSRSLLFNTNNLAYTGGVALNAVCNSRILNESRYNNLYITPAAGDNGLSIGCAYYGWLEILNKPRILHSGNTFFGKSYPEEKILNDINTYISPIIFENPKITDELINILPICLKEENSIINTSCKIQFNLRNHKNYTLLISNKNAKIVELNCNKPSCTIYCDALVLFNSLLNKDYYMNATYNKQIIEIEGTNSLFAFDPIKVNYNIQQILKNNNIKINEIKYYKSNDVTTEAAELLASGKVIAWFQQGSEFGPRALGHRSILADPRIDSIKNFINKHIKFREDFRPFAPSILREDVSDYFEFEGESPYMILIAQAKEICKIKCPGIVHVNGSSRIQTVTRNWNNKYYQLIQKFKQITGIPMLLNTSFNKKGMPIVETPFQAISFFYECQLDNLIIDDYVISK